MAVPWPRVPLAGPSRPPSPCQAPEGRAGLPVVGLNNVKGQGQQGGPVVRPLSLAVRSSHHSAAAAASATVTGLQQASAAATSTEPQQASATVPVTELEQARGSEDGSEAGVSSAREGGWEGKQTAPTPLLSTLTQCAEAPTVPLHFPGHKKGKGAPPQALDAFGQRVFQHDLPELPELDNLFAPAGVLREAQERAAAAFGAAETFFLVNGTTVGLQAAALALCHPGQALVLPRNAHQSAFSAAILAGARPVYLLPAYDEALQHPTRVEPADVAAAIEAAMAGVSAVDSPASPEGISSSAAGVASRETRAGDIRGKNLGAPLQDHRATLPEAQCRSDQIEDSAGGLWAPSGASSGTPPGALSGAETVARTGSARSRIGAVLVVSPTYFGVASDVAGIAAVCRAAGVPLVVDEAHGAHFRFCPSLPPSALEAGADIVVQSTHKVLGSLTQSAMLHINRNSTVLGPRDVQRVARSLQLLQSSSPSYLLLASLDAAAAQVSCPLWAQSLEAAVALARRTADRLAGVPGLAVYRPPDVGGPGPISRGKGENRDRTDSAGVTSSTNSDLEENAKMQKGSEASVAAAPATGAHHDPLRVTVLVRGLGCTGFDADDVLREEFGVVAELPCLGSITFAFGVGTSESDADRLVDAFQALSDRRTTAPAAPAALQTQQLPLQQEAEGEGTVGPGLDEASDAVNPSLAGASEAPLTGTSEGHLTAVCSQALALAQGSPSLPLPAMRLTPREAFFAGSEVVSAAEAVGRVSASLLCPYPPGIPAVVPGEVITEEAVRMLQELAAAGASVNGAEDEELRTFSVVCQ